MIINQRRIEDTDAYRDMRVSGAPLGVCSREDCVDKNEGPNDLCPKAHPFIVAIGQLVGSTTIPLEVGLLERFHKAHPTDGTQALSHHVQQGSDQRHLPSQEQTECHRRVNVPTCAT